MSLSRLAFRCGALLGVVALAACGIDLPDDNGAVPGAQPEVPALDGRRILDPDQPSLAIADDDPQAEAQALQVGALEGVFNPPRAFAGNGGSEQRVSADGRFLVLRTVQPLVPEDTNGAADIYRLDLTTNETVLVSVSTSGATGNGGSSSPVLSADGGVVVFSSAASNLVANDTNGAADVFVRTLGSTPTTSLVSVSTSGGSANSISSGPVLSADGSLVAFTSAASNLVANDTNGTQDVFVRTLGSTATTSLVSVGTSGGSGNSNSLGPVLSADGRLVAFVSNATNLVANADTNGNSDVFVRTLGSTPTTSLVSVGTSGGSGNSFSDIPVLSADGSVVAFRSNASNLVANADTNGTLDVFVRTLGSTPTTSLVSVSTSGGSGNGSSDSPVLAADGSVVAFSSNASNLVANDTNGTTDVFVRTLGATPTMSLASVSTSASSGNRASFSPVLAADGSVVAFSSNASNLVANDTNGTTDVFLRTLGATPTMSLASVSTSASSGNGASASPVLSPDGSVVAFFSEASDLVTIADTNGITDVFVRTLGSTLTTFLPGSFLTSTTGGSVEGRVSADGRFAVFTTGAALVGADTNGTADVYRLDRTTGDLLLVSVSTSGGSGNSSSLGPVLSADGRVVAFVSSASNLVANADTNGTLDVFVRTLGSTPRPARTPPWRSP